MESPGCASKSGAAALLVCLSLAAGGCGDSADDQAKTSPKKVAPAVAGDLGDLLMQAGEEPGFRPGAFPDQMPRGRETFASVDAFAKEMGLSEADKSRLRSEGFISFTASPIRDSHETAGVTNVAIYETAEGAKHSMANDLRPEVIRSGVPLRNLEFFTVSGVPGARGWKASDPSVANVLWVEGRCYFTLGNGGRRPGPFAFVAELSKGVRAIYKRTKGRCA